MTATSHSPLSPEELLRYHRHLVLPGVGEEGQQRLRAARALIIGAGGLGSPCAMYLAAAGVGFIGIVDADVVEASNLQRQLLHRTRDVGAPKVQSAEATMRDINPHVQVATYHARLSRTNARDIVSGYDLVIDGSDNFPTRYLVNDTCVPLGICVVYGSVSRFDGQASVFGGDGPCYRCLFPEPPAPGTVPDCAVGGVFGVLPGMIGMIQATEAIKLTLGIGDTLQGRLLHVDALRMRFHDMDVPRDPACPVCGAGTLAPDFDYDAFCGVKSDVARADTGVAPDDDSFETGEITPRALDARLKSGARIALLDVREPYEWGIAHIADARLIPLASLPNAVNSLDRDAELVVYCHHGMRSDAAAEWLRDNGFRKVLNLTGGIDRWSLEVDRSLRRY